MLKLSYLFVLWQHLVTLSWSGDLIVPGIMQKYNEKEV